MKTTGSKVSLAGAIAVIIGSFLPWTTIPLGGGYSYRGTMLALSVFSKWDSMSLADSVVVSAGALIILLGVAAAVGVLSRLTWLTWIAGALVTALLGLLIIRFLGESDPDWGLLLAFAGGVTALVGSFVSTRRDAAST